MKNTSGFEAFGSEVSSLITSWSYGISNATDYEGVDESLAELLSRNGIVATAGKSFKDVYKGKGYLIGGNVIGVLPLTKTVDGETVNILYDQVQAGITMQLRKNGKNVGSAFSMIYEYTPDEPEQVGSINVPLSSFVTSISDSASLDNIQCALMSYDYDEIEVSVGIEGGDTDGFDVWAFGICHLVFAPIANLG